MLSQLGHEDRITDYSPIGYAELQFGSPGFDLPVGCLMRSRPVTFLEYHTSDDSLELITPTSLAESVGQILQILDVLEHNRAYRNLRPDGEPMLGRYDLYRAYGQPDDRGQLQTAILWTLNLSDGRHSLLDIVERAGLPFALLHRAAELLSSHQLIEPMEISPAAEPPAP